MAYPKYSVRNVSASGINFSSRGQHWACARPVDMRMTKETITKKRSIGKNGMSYGKFNNGDLFENTWQ
jgi:hypothetical protein